MLGIQLLPLLAWSGMSGILVMVLLASMFLYLGINGLRTGKTRGKGATYTQEENFVMFWIHIFIWFFGAFLVLVMLLAAAFAP